MSARVTVRFWAGARRAAGHAEEHLTAATVAQLIDLLSDRPALTQVMQASSFLVDGVATSHDQPLQDGMTVDVLPPFAGG